MSRFENETKTLTRSDARQQIHISWSRQRTILVEGNVSRGTVPLQLQNYAAHKLASKGPTVCAHSAAMQTQEKSKVFDVYCLFLFLFTEALSKETFIAGKSLPLASNRGDELNAYHILYCCRQTTSMPNAAPC